MTSELPLKVRVGVRDQWDSPKAPITSCIDSLAKTLGYTIVPQAQWPSLYNALKGTFMDSTFVPAICRIGIAFYGRMLTRLETEKRTDWIDKLLDEMAKHEDWMLEIKASDDPSLQRPRITWRVDDGAFDIEIPNFKPPGNSIIEAGFDEDLDKLFSKPLPPPPPASVASPIEIPKILVETTRENDWTDVSEALEELKEITPIPPPPPKPSAEIVPLPIVQPAPAVKADLPAQVIEENEKVTEDWPPVDTSDLHPPFKLFQMLAPHVFTISAINSTLVVHCSHQASLEYLESYLKKWAKIDSGDSLRRPALKIEKFESAFFADVIDTMTIEPTFSMRATEPLNPTLILAFVEGVLGYKETYTNGTRWVFKLDRGSISRT